MARATDRATDARDRMLAAAYRYGAAERGGYDGMEDEDALAIADARLLEAAHYLMVVAEEERENGRSATP